MPTYPLTLPTVPAPSRTAFRLRRAVAVTEAWSTGQQQVYEHQLAVWECEVTLPPMPRFKAGPWISFLLECHGRAGTFYLGDWDSRTPRGSARVATVNGAGQTGTAISLGGMVAGATLLPGDMIQLNSGSASKLHMITGGGNSANGGGVAVFQVEPAIRSAPANGSVVTLVNPKGVFRMSSNDTGWNSDALPLYGVTFSCHEAL